MKNARKKKDENQQEMKWKKQEMKSYFYVQKKILSTSPSGLSHRRRVRLAAVLHVCQVLPAFFFVASLPPNNHNHPLYSHTSTLFTHIHSVHTTQSCPWLQ